MKPTCVLLLMLPTLWPLAGCRQCGNESPSATTPATSAPTPSTGAPASAPATVERAKGKLPAPRTVGKPNDRAPLGTNLSPVSDWSTERPFIDVFRMSRPFFSGTASKWQDERPLETDAHGWVRRLAPGQVARSIVFSDTSHFPAGRYTVLYDGQGTLKYEGTARLDDKASKPGRDIVELDPARGDLGLVVKIVSTDPEDPIRHIRVLSPGGACKSDPSRWCDPQTACPEGDACLDFEQHHEELVFHPEFLRRTRRYGMLRFMDMMGTNNSPVTSWDDRPRMEDQTWVSDAGGVPLPVLAMLANRLHAQPWFCIPHRADDDYVRHFAREVKARVDPDLPIWIEYSNEVWNGMFGQNKYAAQRGQKSLGVDNPHEAQLRYYAKRSLEIFRLFEKHLGPDRLVKVVASQAGNAWSAGEILRYPELGEHADALAIAPYFGWGPTAEDLPEVRKMGVEDLLRRAREKSLPEARKYMQQHAEIARKHGLALVAYEAGQHFVGVMGGENDGHLNQIFDALNRHPEMKALYLAYLQSWKEAGGQWLNHYCNCGAWSKWGRWGALEYIDQPRAQAPKFDALMTFVDQHPRWW